MKIERMQYHDALYSQGNARKAIKKKKGREEAYSVDPESDKQKQQFEEQAKKEPALAADTEESVVAHESKTTSGKTGLNIVV